jgi:hypothetical protein
MQSPSFNSSDDTRQKQLPLYPCRGKPTKCHFSDFCGQVSRAKKTRCVSEMMDYSVHTAFTHSEHDPNNSDESSLQQVPWWQMTGYAVCQKDWLPSTIIASWPYRVSSTANIPIGIVSGGGFQNFASPEISRTRQENLVAIFRFDNEVYTIYNMTFVCSIDFSTLRQIMQSGQHSQ